MSLLDIAWAVTGMRDVEAHGGLLDEERVNKLRYSEGDAEGLHALDRHRVGDRGCAV